MGLHGTTEDKVDGGVYGRVGYDYQLNRVLTVGAALGYGTLDESIKVFTLRAAAKAHYRQPKFDLYGGLGVGYISQSVNDIEGTSFASFSILGGLDYLLRPQNSLGLFIEFTPEQEVTLEKDGKTGEKDALTMYTISLAYTYSF